eukprot:3110678-Amphidinium_carterae.1
MLKLLKCYDGCVSQGFGVFNCGVVVFGNCRIHSFCSNGYMLSYRLSVADPECQHAGAARRSDSDDES